MSFRGVEMSGFQLCVSRRFVAQRQLQFLKASVRVLAPAFQFAELSIEFRRVGDEFLDSGSKRAILLSQEFVLVVQACALLATL